MFKNMSDIRNEAAQAKTSHKSQFSLSTCALTKSCIIELLWDDHSLETVTESTRWEKIYQSTGSRLLSANKEKLNYQLSAMINIV